MGSAAITVLLVACALVPFDPPAPQVEVIVVNGSAEEVAFVVEEPDGAVNTGPVQACSTSAYTFDAGCAWRLEADGEAVAISDLVVVLDAPVTIVRLDVGPDA